MIITRTPFRVSFFGGGTDYPAWYKKNGGAVLSTTIDKYCYVSLRYLPPFFEHKYRLVYSKTEDVKTIDEIHHPTARECLKYMGIDKGIEIHHDGDLPARSGIGTSSSFTVGLLQALFALNKKKVTRVQLALAATFIEQDMVKENVGNQDQIAASLGGFRVISFNKGGSFIALPACVNQLVVDNLEKHLMLVFTGFPHVASDVAQSYDYDKANNALRQMQSQVAEACDILNSNDILEFGKLLDKTWQLKKQLSPKVSTPYTDYIYEKATKAGAIGGKVLGAGGGGFMLLFAEPDKHNRIKEALDSLLFVPFKFEKEGTQVIFNNGN